MGLARQATIGPRRSFCHPMSIPGGTGWGGKKVLFGYGVLGGSMRLEISEIPEEEAWNSYQVVWWVRECMETPYHQDRVVTVFGDQNGHQERWFPKEEQVL